MLHYIDSKLIDDLGWTWLDGAGTQQILAAAIAGGLAAVSAYKTGDAEPGRVAQAIKAKKARNEWIDAQIEAEGDS